MIRRIRRAGALHATCACALLASCAYSWADEPAAAPSEQPPVAKQPDDKQSADRAPTDEQRAEIARLFDTLQQATANEDGHAITRAFDLARAMRQISKQGAFAGADLMEIVGVRWGLEIAMRFQPMTLFPDSQWKRHQLGRVQLLDDPNEVVAYVRHADEFEDPFWVRWYLRHDREHGWRVFDYEALGPLRSWTRDMAGSARQSRDGGTNHLMVRLLLTRAYDSIQSGEVESADEMLAQLDEMDIPADAAACRWLYAAYAAEHRGQGEAILEHLAKAQKINPDIPMAPALEARAYVALGQLDKAIEAARRSIAQIGPDAEMHELIGNSLVKLDRPQEALAEFRQGLAQQPNSQACFLGLARVLPAGQKGELGPLFLKIDAPRDNFSLLVGSLYFERDKEAIDAVIAAYRTKTPDDWEADYYDAMARMIEKKYAAAAEILFRVLPKVDDEYERERFQEAYLDAMIEADQSLAAYEAIEDHEVAFNYLASQLHARNANAEIRAIVAAHRKRAVDDPWLYYYQALAEMGEKQFDDAEKSLLAGIRRTLNPEILEAFRSQRVLLRHRAGRPLDAYQQVPPARDTFKQLAETLLEDEDSKQLGQLIAMHRANDPQDPALPIWDAEDKWLRRDYAAAVETLIAHRDDILDSDEHLYVNRFEDLLVRGLVRLQRFEEAQSIAESIHTRDDDPWPLIIVHSARGDAEKTAECLAEYIGVGAGFIGNLYADPDVGPALRSDAFAKLREKYPDPGPQDKESEEKTLDPNDPFAPRFRR